MDDLTTLTQYGQDDASDAKEGMCVMYPQIVDEMTELTIDPSDGTSSEIQFTNLQVPMPLVSTGLVTFAYRRALLNRIRGSKLNEGGRYDLSRYTPTFLHDTLMLPGSLANLLGKGSSEDVLKRLTPALLPGHHVHILSKGSKPCLVRSNNPTTYVQGMVLFGQGKRARQFIHQHYRPHAKRRRVPVEIEVMVVKAPEHRQHEHDLWQPQRRTILVHVWKKSGEIEGCTSSQGTPPGTPPCPNWTLEGYFAGTLAPELPLRIEKSAKGDEEVDGYLGRDIVEYDIEVERREAREVIYGAPGRLAYERIQGNTWSGW